MSSLMILSGQSEINIIKKNQECQHAHYLLALKYVLYCLIRHVQEFVTTLTVESCGSFVWKAVSSLVLIIFHECDQEHIKLKKQL